MQNNVTELTQKLLRSLDSNYNVIDMPAVIEIISLLEKVSITKELLETTRLGKYVNQLRRNTNNESLAKRAKDLVKKWRDMVLPDSNGQLKSNDTHQHPSTETDVQNSKKRSAKEALESSTAKRSRMNGQMSELDFSDNSNSSFKDVVNTSKLTTTTTTKPVIIINSDSNSSMPDTRQDPLLEQQQPKKRGRKKGSKNHKNLIEEAETSFSNKLNVSRGNAKVKTTQELLADLHIRNSTANNIAAHANAASKPMEDLNERAAKLTERVSIIDQKLNANSNRYRNSQKKFNLNKSSSSSSSSSNSNNATDNKGEVVLESGMVSNLKSAVVTNASSSLKDLAYLNLKNSQQSHLQQQQQQSNTSVDDEVIIVDDNESETVEQKDKFEVRTSLESSVPKSLTVEEALALLPPIDRSVLDEKDPEPPCNCQLIENKTDFSVEDDDEEINLQHTFEFVEDGDCLAKSYFLEKFHLDSEGLHERVERLHSECLPGVNGNFSVGSCKDDSHVTQENGLYVNVVPNVNTENLPKFSSIDYMQPASENFKKYSISEKLTPHDNNDDDDDGHDNKKCVSEGVAKNDNCEPPESTLQNGGSDSNNGRSNSDNNKTFREWHEVLETPSYNGEILKILPYVIID